MSSFKLSEGAWHALMYHGSLPRPIFSSPSILQCPLLLHSIEYRDRCAHDAVDAEGKSRGEDTKIKGGVGG